MPYPKRISRARKAYRRRRKRLSTWYNQKYSVGDLAKTAYVGVKYLAGLVNSELYKADGTATVTIGNDGAEAYHLSNIAQGDGDNARTGNSIFVRGVLVKAQYNIAAASAASNVRMIIVKDNQQSSDSTPALSTVLEALTMVSPLNSDTVGCYTILHDCVTSLSTNYPTGVISKFIPMKHHVRYNGTAGSDIQKGGIFLYFISDEAIYEPALKLHYRLSYHDN